jgi:adenine/guanine/hypoxanthine permease
MPLQKVSCNYFARKARNTIGSVQLVRNGDVEMGGKKDTFQLPLFVRSDIDGFIGLFIDNLVNLLLITGLCLKIGMPEDLVFKKILPGTALSVLAGNLFYSYQARKLAIAEQRPDVTALPYGINTVSLFAFFSFIIAPVFLKTGDADLAWKVGVACCFVSGIFEGLGAVIGDRIRRISPRASLLATLSGIALAFIALNHTLPIWEKPLIAFVPLAFILAGYFSGIRLPFRIPAGIYALALGAIIAWTTGAMDLAALKQSLCRLSVAAPSPALSEILSGIQGIAPYLGIAIPMGIMSFFGTLQNIESASAAGDSYPAFPALAMNGVGTMVGALFGSPFPTTVYIGHPGWKALGARAGYSIINGAVMTLICITGVMGVVLNLVPLEAGYPILLWIGLIITAQAFQTTPRSHAPAIALGLMPAISGWGLSLIERYAAATGGNSSGEIRTILAEKLPELNGLIPFSQGPLLSAMFLTAVTVYLIEKDFLKAFYWTLPLIGCSFFGFIHASEVGFAAGGPIWLGYALFAAVILGLHFYNTQRNSFTNGGGH